MLLHPPPPLVPPPRQVPGGALQESVLVDGVAFKRTFSYAYTILTRVVPTMAF